MLEGNYTIKEVIKDDLKEYFLQDGTKVIKVKYKPRKNPLASPLYLVSLTDEYITGIYPFKETQSLEPSKLKGWYKGDFGNQKYLIKVKGKMIEIEKYVYIKK